MLQSNPSSVVGATVVHDKNAQIDSVNLLRNFREKNSQIIGLVQSRYDHHDSLQAICNVALGHDGINSSAAQPSVNNILQGIVLRSPIKNEQQSYTVRENQESEQTAVFEVAKS